MKTSIEHLPKKKQDQLRHIVSILTEQVDAEMIILFGSYARGDWVEELAPDRHHYQYQSDYDIYVLVRNRKVAKRVNRRQELRDLIRREIQMPITLSSLKVWDILIIVCRRVTIFMPILKRKGFFFMIRSGFN